MNDEHYETLYRFFADHHGMSVVSREYSDECRRAGIDPDDVRDNLMTLTLDYGERHSSSITAKEQPKKVADALPTREKSALRLDSKKRGSPVVWLTALMLSLAGCEHAAVGTEADTGSNVTVMVQTMEPISRTAVGDVATRLQVAAYQNGERVRQVTETDPTGNVTLQLADGEYTLLALAHSCESFATTTNPERVTFSGKVTDTFVKALPLTVSGTTATTMTLDRCVARIRLTPRDTIPQDASRVKLYYTGGSSTLDALTARGCVSSRQTEYREPAAYYDIYTFPHADNELLSVTITTLRADGEVLSEQRLDNITIRTGYQSNVTASIFGSSQQGDFAISITNDDWQTIDITFQ